MSRVIADYPRSGLKPIMGSSGQNSSVVCPQPTSSFPEVATATWTRLRPVAMTVQHDLESLGGPVLAHLQPHMNRATAWTDRQLESLQPWQIALLAIGGTWVVLKLLRWLSDLVADVRDVGETHFSWCCFTTTMTGQLFLSNGFCYGRGVAIP